MLIGLSLSLYATKEEKKDQHSQTTQNVSNSDIALTLTATGITTYCLYEITKRLAYSGYLIFVDPKTAEEDKRVFLRRDRKRCIKSDLWFQLLAFSTFAFAEQRLLTTLKSHWKKKYPPKKIENNVNKQTDKEPTTTAPAGTSPSP